MEISVSLKVNRETWGVFVAIVGALTEAMRTNVASWGYDVVIASTLGIDRKFAKNIVSNIVAYDTDYNDIGQLVCDAYSMTYGRRITPEITIV